MDSEHEAMLRETLQEQENERRKDLDWENKIRKQNGLPPLPPFAALISNRDLYPVDWDEIDYSEED